MGGLPRLLYRPETWTKVKLFKCTLLFGRIWSFSLDWIWIGLTNSMVIQVSNIIFLDSPVGAGFSYSVKEQGYNSSDTKAVNHILIFLKKVLSLLLKFQSHVPLYIGAKHKLGYACRNKNFSKQRCRIVSCVFSLSFSITLQWFDEHPEFLSNPLYIGGDSYAGMIVPTVTSEIAKGNISLLNFSLCSLFFLTCIHF